MESKTIYVAINEDNGIEKIRATELKQIANAWIDQWKESKENDGYDVESPTEYYNRDTEAYVTETESDDGAKLSIYKIELE